MCLKGILTVTVTINQTLLSPTFVSQDKYTGMGSSALPQTAYINKQ